MGVIEKRGLRKTVYVVEKRRKGGKKKNPKVNIWLDRSMTVKRVLEKRETFRIAQSNAKITHAAEGREMTHLKKGKLTNSKSKDRIEKTPIRILKGGT